MCLITINKERRPRRKYVYKLVENQGGYRYRSIYMGKWNFLAPRFYYTKGVNVSSRDNTELTPKERNERNVGKGFHFYLKLSEARKAIGSSSEEIWKVEVNPSDWVADGTFSRKQAAVYTKFKYVKTIN